MSGKQIKKTPVATWGILAVMAVLAGAAVVYIVKVVLSGDGSRKKSPVSMITLLKPPPPPPIKEKPPEPEQPKEIPKKEEEKVFTPVPQDARPQDAANQDSRPANDQPPGAEDNTPPGDNLGVDAEGSAGGDAFGLVGKKGGRSLLAGGGGSGGLGRSSRFSGYTHIVETESRKKVMKRLDEEGGIPKGSLQVIVRISVDGDGTVVDCKIIGSSGNHKMDDTVKQSLSYMKISEPPPDGKPSMMTIKITSQG